MDWPKINMAAHHNASRAFRRPETDSVPVICCNLQLGQSVSPTFMEGDGYSVGSNSNSAVRPRTYQDERRDASRKGGEELDHCRTSILVRESETQSPDSSVCTGVDELQAQTGLQAMASIV